MKLNYRKLRRFRLLQVFCAALVGASLTGFAVENAYADTIYKVVGPDGKVSYSTNPPPNDQKSTLLRMDVPAPEASKPGSTSATPKATVPATKQAASAEQAKSPLQFAREMLGFGGANAAAASNAERKPAAASSATKTPIAHGFAQSIFFYQSTGCNECDAAKKFLEKNKINVRSIDVATEDGRRALNEVDRRAKLPLLLAQGKRVSGFSPETYEVLLMHK